MAVQERVQIAARTNTTDPNRSAPKVEITKEAVQQKVRNTMGQMGNAGKTRGMKQKIKARNKEERANDRRETNLRKEKESKILKVTEFLTANELATMMNINVTQVISTCFLPAVDDLGPATAKWDYHDSAGKLVAVVYRYDPQPGDYVSNLDYYGVRANLQSAVDTIA